MFDSCRTGLALGDPRHKGAGARSGGPPPSPLFRPDLRRMPIQGSAKHGPARACGPHKREAGGLGAEAGWQQGGEIPALTLIYPP